MSKDGKKQSDSILSNYLSRFEYFFKSIIAQTLMEARLYVGLSDMEIREQLHDTEHCKGIIKEICKSYRVPFSLQIIEGGYFHDDGTYVDENTLLITLIGAPKKMVSSIASDVCDRLHQESVMIVYSEVLPFSERHKKKGKSD